MNVPQWVSWVLVGIGLLVAITLTIQELRQKTKEINDKLVKQEWEYGRQYLIEQRKPYLPQIPDTLRDMRQRLNELTEAIISDSPTITREILETIAKHIFSTVGIPKTDNQIIEYFMRISWALNAYHIGLKEVIEKDTKWKNLQRRLDDVLNPDKLLASLVERYIIYLNGIGSDKLHGHYLDKVYGNKAERIENDPFLREVNALGAGQYFDRSLRQLESDIVKRIEYLMSGGEAK